MHFCESFQVLSVLGKGIAMLIFDVQNIAQPGSLIPYGGMIMVGWNA